MPRGKEKVTPFCLCLWDRGASALGWGGLLTVTQLAWFCSASFGGAFLRNATQTLTPTEGKACKIKDMSYVTIFL